MIAISPTNIVSARRPSLDPKEVVVTCTAILTVLARHTATHNHRGVIYIQLLLAHLLVCLNLTEE